jgi:hypothetical protein
MIFSMLCLLFAADKPAPLPNVYDVERQVLQYRRSIQRGHMVFKQKTFVGGNDKPAHERVSTFWFEGDKFRSDVVIHNPVGADPVREVSCRNCEREGHVVWYIEEKGKEGIIGLRLQKEQEARKQGVQPVIDPRLLGMTAASVPNFTKYHLESYVGKHDRQEPTVQRDRWKGKDCWQIDYRDMRGTSYRYYVDPERGPSVIYLKVSWDYQGHHYMDSVEATLQQFGPSKIWFPQSCVYQQEMDGKLLEKEVVDVEVISLKEPLDSDTFTLVGMKIPPDTFISGLSDPRGNLFWNGKEIVPESELPRNKYTSNPTTQRWMLIGNAIFFAVLAVYLLWRYWRQRKTV